MVPEDIRKVSRPRNSVVIDTGHVGMKRYEVKTRKTVRYVKGGNPQPVNGSVIGYIFDGKFISRRKKAEGVEIKSFGGSQLVWMLSKDVFHDLSAVYDVGQASQIYAIAALRVLRKHISDRRLATAYSSSWISELLPNVALSESTVSKLIKDLGNNYSRIVGFMQRRVKCLEKNHHVAIDGTLKQDSSTVNDLSEYSYKARKKGIREISVLYAYDIEKREPICSKVFPGNMIDATSYDAFIRENGIESGLLVDDKGFPPSRIKEVLAANKGLGFLTPLKRDAKAIAENSMYVFDSVIETALGNIPCKKCTLKKDLFLYSFREGWTASKEESDYLKRHVDGFDKDDFRKKSAAFGTIVLESNRDLDLKTAYDCYDSRWLIELVFRYYKNSLDLDQTREQNNSSVIGSEFINFVSSLITMRLVNRFSKTEKLDGESFGDILDDLNSVQKIKVKDEWEYAKMNPRMEDILDVLQIKNKPVVVTKKRGRPKKQAV